MRFALRVGVIYNYNTNSEASSNPKKVSDALRTDLEQQIMYFNSLNDNQQANLAYENQLVQQTLQQVQGMEQYFTKPAQVLTPENQKPVINTLPKTQQDTQVRDQP